VRSGASAPLRRPRIARTFRSVRLIFGVALLVVAGGAASVEAAESPTTLRCQKTVQAAALKFAGARDRVAGQCVGALGRCTATLRATIRKKCDAGTLLGANGVGFGQSTAGCTANPALDPVDAAIACLADAHVCASARSVVTVVPPTAARVRTSGAF
jgi:hypothetical protein